VNRFISLLFLFALVLPQAVSATPPTLSGKVLWIYDGDTIKVENIGKVRLLGIDTPERKDSDRDRYYLRQDIKREHLRFIAHEALQFMIKTVKGKYVTLHTDHEPQDRHGRLLAYVYLPDGKLLNRVLVEEGYAAVYRKFSFRKKQEFLAAEKRARASQRGLWRPGN
jgi:micrococcal nuclease